MTHDYFSILNHFLHPSFIRLTLFALYWNMVAVWARSQDFPDWNALGRFRHGWYRVALTSHFNLLTRRRAHTSTRLWRLASTRFWLRCLWMCRNNKMCRQAATWPDKLRPRSQRNRCISFTSETFVSYYVFLYFFCSHASRAHACQFWLMLADWFLVWFDVVRIRTFPTALTLMDSCCVEFLQWDCFRNFYDLVVTTDYVFFGILCFVPVVFLPSCRLCCDCLFTSSFWLLPLLHPCPATPHAEA